MDHDLERARALLLSMGGDPETMPRGEVEMAQHAADLVLRVAGDRSIEDMARSLSTEVETLGEILEHLGILTEATDAAAFTEADQALLAVITGADDGFLTEHDVHGYLRVLGRTMATAAEAAVAVHTRLVDPRVESAAGWVEANAAMARLGVALAGHLGTMFHHHLRQAVDFQRRTHGGGARGEVLRLATCFVDVSGFTGLSARVSVQAIEEFVDLLESTAATLAIRHGVRLVKMIGDEVMLVGPDAPDMGCAALCLIDDLADGGYRARGGMAHGEVAMVHGDYFGPVVNLASRLAGLAAPGQVLTDQRGAAAIASSTAADGSALRAITTGDRAVRGLDAPVPTFVVAAAEDP